MKDEIKIGDFVWIDHPHAWKTANDLGVLSLAEMNREGFVKGQVIGTWGPVKDGHYWDIIPDCWIAAKLHVMKVLNTYSSVKKFDYNDGFDGEKYKKYVQGIIPDLSVGSCQLNPDRVFKDVERTRNWGIMTVTGNFSELEKCDPREYIIEKAIVDQTFENYKKKQWKMPTTTNMFGSMPV